MSSLWNRLQYSEDKLGYFTPGENTKFMPGYKSIEINGNTVI